MTKKASRAAAIRYVKKLALGKSNDAVKLLLSPPECLKEELGELDLSMVAEMKKGAKGEVEVKFFNRIALLELLARLMSEEDEEPEDGSEAESFFTAMDRAAARLGEDDEI